MSARRNPGAPQRNSEANEARTLQRVEGYYLVRDLLRTWELQPDNVQADNHDYIIKLRAKERRLRGYLLHRAADIQLCG